MTSLKFGFDFSLGDVLQLISLKFIEKITLKKNTDYILFQILKEKSLITNF